MLDIAMPQIDGHIRMGPDAGETATTCTRRHPHRLLFEAPATPRHNKEAE
ncbi:MAG TPA: hypothetical protein VLN59_02945 [Burkholderiales bacterium]|nr:hypothetical protein [Burkholderiales bacterium]